MISDLDFFRSEALGTLPYPYLYVNYIGWIAIVLAAFGCYALWRTHQIRLALFFLSWSIGAMWISSAMPLAWIRDLTSPVSALHELVIGMRHPSLIAGLAIPSLLALSAIGVDSLVKRRPRGIHAKLWLGSTMEAPRALRFDPRWLLVIPLALALRSEQRFADQFLGLSRQPIETMSPVLDALTTSDAQWIGPPFGEEYWIGQLAERNLKWGPFGRVWHWKGRTDPVPVLEATRMGPQEGKTLVTTASEIEIYAPPPGNEYAAVTHADGTRTVCTASSLGGDINVTCDLSQPGRLEVKENYFSGWKANAGEKSLDVVNAEGWMDVELPAGQSTVEFRFRPWDVPAGVLLMIAGLAIAGYCIIRREPQAVGSNEETVVDLLHPAGEPAMAD